ncbi:unnamed protein product, partial [Ectocarpus sp. 12 AP-2014]
SLPSPQLQASSQHRDVERNNRHRRSSTTSQPRIKRRCETSGNTGIGRGPRGNTSSRRGHACRVRVKKLKLTIQPHAPRSTPNPFRSCSDHKKSDADQRAAAFTHFSQGKHTEK